MEKGVRGRTQAEVLELVMIKVGVGTPPFPAAQAPSAGGTPHLAQGRARPDHWLSRAGMLFPRVHVNE